MSKRTSQPDRELPLFDLPLQTDAESTSGPSELGPEELRPSEKAGEGGLGPTSLEPVAAAKPARKPRKAAPEPTPEPEPEPEAPAPEARALAGASPPVGRRLMAGLADLAIQVAILGVAVTGVAMMDVPVAASDAVPFAVLALVLSFLYEFIPLAFWGRTPGMAWTGLAARGLADEPLSFAQTALRWIGGLLTLAFAGLPLLLALTGRSLTDRLSDSKTVG